MDSQRVAHDTRLVAIPLEVLLQITSNLNTPDYGKLRCTCKTIEATLFSSFSREFFTKRQFMLTEPSLQALVDISKSRLSSSLKHVIFGLERPNPRSSLFNDFGDDTRSRRNCLLQECTNHMTFINTNQDVEMLVDAFSNLCNLETIGIRDFNSRSRRRDYPNVEWRSYGAPTFELESGSRLEWPHLANSTTSSAFGFNEQETYISRLFLNLYRALAKAHARPKHFEVILRQNGLRDHAFNLPKYLQPIVQPVLANIRTLLLDLSSEYPPCAYVGDVNNSPTKCPNYHLRIFLSNLSQLEHLRLNFQFYPREETNDVLSWFSKPVSVASASVSVAQSLPESPKPVEFINLRELDIGMVTIEPQFLLAIIQKYRATLRIISLHKVTLLYAGSVNSVVKLNLWAKFFGQLAKLDLNLSAINMSVLFQAQAGKSHYRPVTFKGSRQPNTKRWAATDVQSGLRDFINDVVVDNLHHDTESSQSDGSSNYNSDSSMNSEDVDGDEE